MNELWKSTSYLYNNPLTVTRAVGDIKVDVLSIHRDIRILPFEEDQVAIEKLIMGMDAYDADITQKLAILKERYLGPQSDVVNAAEALGEWKSIRNETIRLFREGQIDQVEERIKATGVGGMKATVVLNALTTISDFASNKADALFLSAQEQRNHLIRQMLFFSFVMFALLTVIGVLLRKGILPPLAKLTAAIEDIKHGKLDTRIENDALNELGMVSRAFNSMSDIIQAEIKYKENTSVLSSVLVEYNNLLPFCNKLLSSLSELTDSQIGAIYFLNESNRRFEYYASIGLNQKDAYSFSSDIKEGEFGAVLARHKVVHLTEIPSDAQLSFNSVSGDFKIKEIITIPVLNGNDIIAIISLASIKAFSDDAIRLINGVVNEIGASLNAVVASERVLEFSRKLQETNIELEGQAKELTIQAEELAQQNTELEIQKNQLGEVSRLKTNFLSNMSHELRTPLNSVIALSGVLSRRLVNKISDEESNYLEIIERNGKNLLTLINDILDISRIEAGREEIETTSFNVNQTIAEVVEMLHAQAEQQNIDLIHVARDAEILVLSDSDKLRHILQNLIGNAVKFTQQGSVEIRTNQGDDFLEIIITDTGIGIPAEHIPHIFDEFRQADSSTSRRFGGTGLGLAISQKYANLLGGTITVKSTPDIGSEFKLKLPYTFDIEKQFKAKAESNSISEKQYGKNYLFNNVLVGKHILVVEDNESAVIQIQDLMDELGCKVSIAQNAKQAISIIGENIPDAMILDLMMPEVDGFELLEILRNEDRTAHIPVMILSAKHLTKDDLRFLKRNNIHQLIQKGDIKRHELQQAIINMLNSNKQKTKMSLRTEIKDKPLVLVVEDNPDNMLTVKALLEDRCHVVEAVNAYEGIELTKKLTPNLVLMDIALPDINGIEAFKEIRKIPQTQHIPVIALTASVMQSDRETILSHGFDAFIAKPIIANEFVKVIDEVLYGK